MWTTLHLTLNSDTEKCHIKCSTFKATWLIMRDHFILTVCAQLLGRIRLFASPWTTALQAPLAYGIFQARKLEWVAIFLLQAIFQTQGSNPHLFYLLHSQAESLPLVPPGETSYSSGWSLFFKIKQKMVSVGEDVEKSKLLLTVF